MSSKTSYQELDDLEKLKKQWHKLSGLHTREEWSAAVVRAATAAEIAANFAIQHEFKSRSSFDRDFVSSVLRSANGLHGKFDRLLLPLSKHNADQYAKVKSLGKIAEKINFKRNSVVHQGEFCNATEARSVISQTKVFITTLIQIYEPNFLLAELQIGE